jgi:opacity protein-like surface antigen
MGMNSARNNVRLNMLTGTLLSVLACLSFTTVQAKDAPSWALEFKGGRFNPDLELYETFYDRDYSYYFGVSGGYRFTDWLELGLELGYTQNDGTGLLPNAGTLGGDVRYILVPVQAYLNLRYDVKPNQRFVPYIGIGVATAWYRQEIDAQPDREGRADFGGAARAGIQVLLSGLDPHGADYVFGDHRLKTYAFLEGQYFSSKINDIDLGGQIYTVGMRFEFD